MKLNMFLRKIAPAQAYMWAKGIQLRQFKPLLKHNKDLEGIHEGKRCFILGNGPSIKELDFSLLKDEYTFTVNQLPRNPNFPKLYTNFHVWSDSIFFNIDKNKPEDMALLNIMKSVKTQDNSPIVFYEIAALNLIKEYRLDEILNIRYFKTVPAYDVEKILAKNYNITNIIPDFSTVVQLAICIAVFMGFKQIYLLGCDCTSFLTYAESRLGAGENSSYGYKIDANEKKRLEETTKIRSLTDELRGYCNLMDKYEVINNVFRRFGVEIYNATPHSLLTTLPYIKLEDVLKNKEDYDQ